MEDELEMVCHNDALSAFNEELYSGIISQENIISKKKVVNLYDSKMYGFFAEKNKITYFIPDELMDKLPFKIDKSMELDYKGEVFTIISSIRPIKIPSQKAASFRDLVDITPKFKHTNPTHFTLYKILAYASWCDRFNARITTDAGFGKDSVVNIISSLVDSTVNLYGATFAKLEYVLFNKLIILNEMGNLKGDDKMNMQEFLLATGAYFNTYNKRTRKTASTQEQYDISKLSLLIFYNLPHYYIGKSQEYFDQMFTKAVVNRFIPFVFEGRITTSFDRLIDPKAIAKEYENHYKVVIATLNYYRENPVTDIKWDIPEKIKFSEEQMRYKRSFLTVLKYIGEYSNTQEEFNDLALELYSCFKKYDSISSKVKEDKRVGIL